MHPAWANRDFEISTDPARVDIAVVHSFLTNCYWAKGISPALVQRSLEHSICFSIFHGNAQIGFARVITDRATFAYLADIFVLEAHRGKGLSKWLMECIQSHPDLQGLRRWMLATRDAHGLYRQFGFHELASPERFMEMHHPYKES
jgi:GNAT superfamily N-acetyltransferase